MYNVLLDGNFVFAALKYKIDIEDRIKALLQENEIKLFALRSAYDELNKAGEKTRSSMQYMKSVCQLLDDSACARSNPADQMIAFLGSFLSYYVEFNDLIGNSILILSFCQSILFVLVFNAMKKRIAVLQIVDIISLLHKTKI